LPVEARPWRDGFGEGKEREKIFGPGGRDNRLKRLISDKGIQGNQSIILGKIWMELGLAWLGFDKFGIGLVFVIQRRSDKEVHAAVAQGASRLTRPRRS
jgi:hypothetical protein